MKIMSQDKKPRVFIRQQFTICSKKVDILIFGYDESSKTLTVSMDSNECNIEWIPYEKNKQPQVMDSPNQDIQFMTHDINIMKGKIDALECALDKTNANLKIQDTVLEEENEKFNQLEKRMDLWIDIVKKMDTSTLDFKTIINEKLAHRVDALAGVMKDEISNLKHQEAKDWSKTNTILQEALAKLKIQDTLHQELIDILNSNVRDNGITKGRVNVLEQKIDQLEKRMDLWVKSTTDLTSAFNASIERIAVLEEENEKFNQLEKRMDLWVEIIEDMDMNSKGWKSRFASLDLKIDDRVNALNPIIDKMASTIDDLEMKVEVLNKQHEADMKLKSELVERMRTMEEPKETEPLEKEKKKVMMMAKDIHVGDYFITPQVKGTLKVIAKFKEEGVKFNNLEVFAIVYKHMESGMNNGHIGCRSYVENVELEIVAFKE
jgi:hypothetical protein